jgi:hypothetical protein
MEPRISLVCKIGLQNVEGMQAHCRLAASGTAHCDGWTNWVGPPAAQQLAAQLDQPNGFFWLLVVNQSLVRWAFRATHALFLDWPVFFADPVHYDRYFMRTLVVYGSGLELEAPCDPGALESWEGGQLKLPRRWGGDWEFKYAVEPGWCSPAR